MKVYERVSIQLDPGELRALDDLVMKMGTSRQDVIRRLLRCTSAAARIVVEALDPVPEQDTKAN